MDQLFLKVRLLLLSKVLPARELVLALPWEDRKGTKLREAVPHLLVVMDLAENLEALHPLEVTKQDRLLVMVVALVMHQARALISQRVALAILQLLQAFQ